MVIEFDVSPNAGAVLPDPCAGQVPGAPFDTNLRSFVLRTMLLHPDGDICTPLDQK